MTLKLLGFETTLIGLQRRETRTHARLRRVAVRGAKKIGNTAREYAPHDRGDLESAIRDDMRVRDERNRLVMLIGVDRALLGPGFSENGFDYAYEMHERYPYAVGDIPNLPHLQGSYSKQAQGKKVGGKYIERAWLDNEESIRAEMAVALREISD